MTKIKQTGPPVPATLAPLSIFEYRSQLVADSRDAAEMLERPHWILIRSIRTYEQHLNDNKIVAVEFFIPSTYKSAS